MTKTARETPTYYTTLFNGVTDAIDAFQHLRYSAGLGLLIQAQQDAEKLFIESTEDEDAVEDTEA